ncbi:protease modulator HflC [Aminiphilus circumscriptus]|jgi:membrane protease subunit HflC|uniref:protease modulator HflC n=1 Tax=Aminiphilus circumscriptus TaxID=290732 RepID=UPI0004AD853C|nr:protease modulator HflC [Aminiphilus circumscriptus]
MNVQGLGQAVRNAVLLVLLVALVAVGIGSFYVIRADQQAVVLRFGKVVRSVRDPGLYLKMPFADVVERFTKRLIEYDADPVAVVTSDKKNLVFDSIAVFRIADPDAFYRRIRTVEGAQQRLDDSVYAAVRIVAGKSTFDELIFSRRGDSLVEATRITNDQTSAYGVEVLKVAFKRVFLPQENEEAVYRSMIAERSRIAAQLRAEGRSIAARLRSKAQRDYTEILAAAQKQAEETRGQGDAEAQRIIADAAGQNPDLYLFLRTLEFYKENLPETPVFLKPGEGILRYLKGAE